MPSKQRLLLVLAATALAGTTGTVHAATRATVLKARLTGAYLHTTSKGSGSATITFKGSKVCWKFASSGLDTGEDSGIHVAPPPAPGKHKTSVFPFTASTSEKPGCVATNHWGPSSASWAAKIAATPGKFYVIIATAKYPQGAIGGVLHGAA